MSTTSTTTTEPAGTRWNVALLVPLLAGCLVAVALGGYGGLHEPTFFAVNLAGFSSGTAVKAWLTTGAFLLAVVQLASAAVLYGRLQWITEAAWVATVHRWSGRVAVLLTAPVVVHCLYALGFQASDVRVLLHSLLGCFFYGAFVAKMLLLGRPALPAWCLPVVGGAVFTAITGLWLTSSLWFFTTTGITF